jgi:putative transposase
MKRKRFTEPQIIFALRQAEGGTPVEEITRKLAIAQATFYRWKKKYAGLGVAEIRRKPPRRRVACLKREVRPVALRRAQGREPCRTASRKNERWSMDFMSDELYDGRRIRVLTIVDNHTRESLATHVAQRIRGQEVVQVLERVVDEHGLPRAIQVDNGPEFISKDLDLWAYWNKVKLDFIRPGKPTDNAFIESFNARFRLECLNEHWFLSLDDAREKIEAWRRDYNYYSAK